VQMLFYAFRLRNTKQVTVFTLHVMCTRALTALVNKVKFHPSGALFGVLYQSHFMYRKSSSPKEITFSLRGIVVHKNLKFLLYVGRFSSFHMPRRSLGRVEV